MFEKLGNAFSKAAKSFSEKDLNEKDIDDVLSELEISLLESDVATEVIDSIKSDLSTKLVGSRVNKKEIEDFVKKSLTENISSMFDDAGSVDILSNIKSKIDLQEPYLILFVGINGTGKTTTIAKIANLLQKNKISVVVAAADTFRAGAIEQLREHINKLNLKLIAQNYGSDPAAVAHDALLYAKSHKVDCVLIDSAGRMQTNKNLMEQIAKISKVVSPDLKIFVGDSLAGNDTVSQAREFHKHTTFDGAILTKSDADARGGAALSIVAVTKKPVIYVGTGQGYDDLELFSKEIFLETVFGRPEPIAEPEPVPEPVPEPIAEPEPVPEPVTAKTYDTETKPSEKIPEFFLEKKKELHTQSEPEPVPEPTAEPEPVPEPTAEPEPVPEPEIKEPSSDPFEGIKTEDIEDFAELFDVPSPSSDKEAFEMAKKIRKWIADGRPK